MRLAQPKPFVVDIEKETLDNEIFRTALWTGEHFQVTVINIPVGGDVGHEVQNKEDQFLRLESVRGRVEMGPSEDEVTFTEEVSADWAVIVPKGTWHNIINIGDAPMKLYSIYAPPHHTHGTVHQTQADDVD
ncbi:cupin [Corynebacterium stationis]|nr:cupin [Corynebacterium stationis]AQX71418.1 cupin [Corynebacterium stationis]ASJ19103.1 cupin [Corynebacterium stationis]